MSVPDLRAVYGTDFLPDVTCHPILQVVTFCDRCGRRISTANTSMDALVIELHPEPRALHGRCARGWAPLRPRCDKDRLRARLVRIRARAAERGRRKQQKTDLMGDPRARVLHGPSARPSQGRRATFIPTSTEQEQT